MNNNFQDFNYGANKICGDFSSRSLLVAPYLLSLALSIGVCSVAYSQQNNVTRYNSDYKYSSINPSSYSEAKKNRKYDFDQISNEEIYDIAIIIKDTYQKLASTQISLEAELEEAIYDGIWELYGQ